MGKAILSNRLYRIYQNMKGRCTRKYNTSYHLYGQRGISVCDEWMKKAGKGFRAFEEWALSNGYQDDLTLDRIDNDGNYEPSNCRWVTVSEQNRNKNNNFRIGTEILQDYSRNRGFNSSTLRYRYKNNQDLTKPTRHRFIVIDNVKYRPAEFSKKYGFNLNSLQTAFNRGTAREYILRAASSTTLDVNTIERLEIEIEERGSKKHDTESNDLKTFINTQKGADPASRF